MKLLPKNIFKENYFGLSLTHSAIRAMSISADGQIQSNAQLQLEANVFTHEVIDANRLAQSLSQLVNSEKFPSKYAAVCIPEYHSFTRSFTIPRIPLNEVREALSWQIESIFPIPKNEIYYDWKLISETETDLNILIVAMPKKTLDQLIQAFETAGIKPISFEPSASAVSRILSIDSNKPHILIELNPSGSSATLIENNISVLTVTNQFISSTGTQDVNQALEKTSHSIQSLINYHQNKHEDGQSEINILLTGDSASNELSNWLSTYLSLPVTLLQIDNVPTPFHQAYAAANTNVKPQDTGLSVNLLPDSLQQLYDAMRIQQRMLTRLKLSFVILILSIASAGLYYTSLVIQANQAQNQLTQLEADNAQYSYDASEVGTLNKVSTSLVTLFPKKTTPVEAYEELFSLKPAAINYTSIVFDAEKKTFTLIGTAADRDDLLALKQILDDSDYFANTNLPLGSLEQPTNVNFSITTLITPPSSTPIN